METLHQTTACLLQTQDVMCILILILLLQEQLVQLPTSDLFSGPVNIKWQEGVPAPEMDAFHTAVLHDGKVYIGGGYGSLCTINIYYPANNLWSPSSINIPYLQFAMTILNNQLIIAGGRERSNQVTKKIFLLDGDRLKEYTRMITRRARATAVGYEGTLIIIGGQNNRYQSLASTELFDSTTGQWYNTNDLPSPHYWLQSVIVDNVLYLLGGCQAHDKVFTAPLDALASHQLKWSMQQDTPWYRSSPVSIQGRHLLTIGGMKSIVTTRDIHMFNRVSHSWEVIGQIPAERCGTAVVSVTDNKIVVVGGKDNEGQNTNTVWIGLWEPQ